MTDCFGIDLDQEYRCLHYHTTLDIVGLKCAFVRLIMLVTIAMTS